MLVRGYNAALQSRSGAMTSLWKIAAPVACVAVICGAAILWWVRKERATERKLAEDARVRAEQGEAKAQFRLGYIYSQGKGVSQDYTEAVRWYRKAADQGDAKRSN
jgi:TPR repeat protein